MTAVARQYLQKRCSAEAVVGKVQSGNHIFFGEFVLRPQSLDEALAQRASDLAGVIIDGVGIMALPKFIEADPLQQHFSTTIGIFPLSADNSIKTTYAAIFHWLTTKGRGSCTNTKRMTLPS